MLGILLTYKCGFQHISHNIKPRTRKLAENVQEIYPEWAPMRIKFNYDYINDQKKDKKGCQNQGQIISWGGESTWCREPDFLNASQKQNLITTMNNVQKYLQTIFSVRRHPNNKIEVKDWEYFFDAPVKEATDCDLFVTVVVRPYGIDSGVAASSASYDFFEDLGHRPRLAGIMINARVIPSEPQDYNSWNNKFFYHCIHEIFHALGISEYLYKDFHPPFSYEPYKNILCNITVKGKKMTFLTTPYSHRWAVRHYNLETYVGDNGVQCPAGIELEDTGGIGTAYGHPKAKAYMTDLMVGLSIQTESGPFMRFTDVSMAMLLDSGNYKINYKYGQPILWGNKDSIDGKTYLDKFPTGPPQLVMPDDYQGTSPRNTLYSCFDYKCAGPLTYESFDCVKFPNFDFCKYIDYYNPLRWTEVGYNDAYDYIRFVYPNTICKRGTAALNSVSSGNKVSVGCINYKFSSDNQSVTFSNDYNSFTCSKETNGKINKLSYSSVPCPDFERFKRSMFLYDSYFLTNPFGDKEMQYTLLNDGKTYDDDEDKVDFGQIVPPQTAQPERTLEPTKPPARTLLPTEKPDEPVQPTSEPEPPTQLTDQPIPDTYEPTQVPNTKVPTTDSNPDADQRNQNAGKLSKHAIIGIAVAAAVVVLVVVVIVIIIFVRRAKSMGADRYSDFSAALNEAALNS